MGTPRTVRKTKNPAGMWNLRGVAGNLRANLKQFATDVMQDIEEPEDEDNDIPRSQQVCLMSKSSLHRR